mmetsp:Transcript_26181/g.47514  ORF Transcript_26181/g.47514 Transcript_26181/m.47514 type:complete len:118 (+) Transcript_26181:588-941(+)
MLLCRNASLYENANLAIENTYLREWSPAPREDPSAISHVQSSVRIHRADKRNIEVLAQGQRTIAAAAVDRCSFHTAKTSLESDIIITDRTQDGLDVFERKIDVKVVCHILNFVHTCL